MADIADEKPNKRSIPVHSSADHTYGQADTIAVSMGMLGDVEVTFLSMRMRVDAQEFEITGRDGFKETLGPPTPQTSPMIEAISTIRMGVPVAVDSAITILRHLIKHGHAKEAITQALRDQGVVD